MIKRLDVLIIVLGLLIAGLVWGGSLLTREAGGEALITADGEEVARLPLNKNTTLSLAGNTVVVEDGEVYVSEADCPDHSCVRQGAVSHKGETIVCLPHRLVVEVTAGEESPVDAVAQ